MKISLFKNYWIFLGALFCSKAAYAIHDPNKQKAAMKQLLLGNTANTTAPSLSKISEDLTSYGSGIENTIKTALLLAGAVLILFGILQYKKHRENPQETPLSAALTLLLLGAALLGLGFLLKYLQGG